MSFLSKLNPVKIFQILKFAVQVFRLGREQGFWNQSSSSSSSSSFTGFITPTNELFKVTNPIFDPSKSTTQNLITLTSQLNSSSDGGKEV